jgi:hypothetical protein
MIVPGGQLGGPFDPSSPAVTLHCQVLYSEASAAERVVDLVTLEPSAGDAGVLPSGTPFTIRWPCDPPSRVLCDAIVTKWAEAGELVVLVFGTTRGHRWVCLRAEGEQLVLEVA